MTSKILIVDDEPDILELRADPARNVWIRNSYCREQ